jgi:alkylation response protein AidB-like acyl-CoA dehydrogenase
MKAVDRQHTLVDTLAEVRGLATTIGQRAEEIERGRRVPSDLLDRLAAVGCFRVLRPASHGGIGADLTSGFRVFETLARADASVAWTVVIGGNAWVDLVGLPRVSFDKLFTSGQNAIFAGVFSPSGSIVKGKNGYVVTGRWSFASGCEHADWLFGNNVESFESGPPRLRMAVFSPKQVEIEDTWNVLGLCGTGSHHFHANNVRVQDEWTLDPFADEPCIDAAIARVPVPAFLSLAIASIAVGIGKGALDDIFEIATKKTPLLADGNLATNAHFQFVMANADTTLQAAQALLYECAGSLWEKAADGSLVSLRDRARIRGAAVWITKRVTEVVTSSFHAAGGSSVYATSPLQRRLRDVNALAQHFLVRDDTLTTAGAILAGQDISVPVF